MLVKRIARTVAVASYLLGVTVASPAAWSAPTGPSSSADFFPPVTGGAAAVKAPAAVKVDEKSVTGATAQDAANAAVAETRKGAEREPGDVREIHFPSGMGYVATGGGTYRTMENPVATRVAKRKAYVIAFMEAKKALAATLGGLSSEGRNHIREAMTNINLPAEEMTNISTSSEESVKQAVDMLLRGFVVYDVKDDADSNRVLVSIVTSPKTRGTHARPTANVVEAADLRAGLDQVIAEVRAGVVPPVGGRIISVPSTGETAFVGFGSSVVRSSDNAAVQAKLNLTARKVAGMHAADALVGLLSGDKTSWNGSVNEKLKDEVKEYEQLVLGDPLGQGNQAGAKKLEKARQTFVSKFETTDEYQSVRKGMVPPGVRNQAWSDADNGWAFAMSVYAPSLSKNAIQAAKEMAEGGPADRAAGKSSAGFTDENDKNVARPGKSEGKGPTGQVTKDGDL